MNKFLDIEEARQPAFKALFDELNNLYYASQGLLYRYYLQFVHKNVVLDSFARQWEYPWAIINSKVAKGDLVLDAGCGSSPLLIYLYKKGCKCFGLDKELFTESPDRLNSTIQNSIAVKLSKFFPFYLLCNPHGMSGLSKFGKPTFSDIKYTIGGLSGFPYKDNTFDRVFCISVIEHIAECGLAKAAKEFRRVLRPGGLLVATIDCWGLGLKWQEFIRASGMELYGESDFNLPERKKAQPYDVVGFVLEKKS